MRFIEDPCSWISQPPDLCANNHFSVCTVQLWVYCGSNKQLDMTENWCLKVGFLLQQTLDRRQKKLQEQPNKNKIVLSGTFRATGNRVQKKIKQLRKDCVFLGITQVFMIQRACGHESHYDEVLGGAEEQGIGSQRKYPLSYAVAKNLELFPYPRTLWMAEYESDKFGHVKGISFTNYWKSYKMLLTAGREMTKRNGLKTELIIKIGAEQNYQETCNLAM